MDDFSKMAADLIAESVALAEKLRASEARRILALIEQTPDESFLDIASLAAHICSAPIAAVSLIDETVAHYKGLVGSGDKWQAHEFTDAPRDIVACNLTLKAPDQPCIIYDAETDDRTVGLPFFNGTYDYCRFYYGLPLTTKAGYAVGTICVLDRMPRKLRKDQAAALERLRRLVLKLYGD